MEHTSGKELNMQAHAKYENGELIRMFFSFHIPRDIAASLLAELKSQNLPVSWYPENNLHMTLKFLGDGDTTVQSSLIRLGSTLAKRFPALTAKAARIAIEDERVRLEFEPPHELLHLHGECASLVKKYALGKDDPKRYVPHITLGRPLKPIDSEAVKLDCSSLTLPIREFGLYRSDQTEDGMGRYTLLGSHALAGKPRPPVRFSTIVLPTRSQPDTLVAIFILKRYGEHLFPGIKEAAVDFWQVVPEGETEESLDRKGIVLFDLGGGKFDHHGGQVKTTASDLVATYLGVLHDPSLAKMLEYARRDDFYGKGTISNDPIDRAFCLSALVAHLNRSLVKNPERVVDIVMPLLVAHHNEEVRRAEELPKEFNEVLSRGEAELFDVKQRGKKLKVVSLASESGSMAGYLRSQNGGKFDVVAQWLPSGHVNILTRPAKRIDLRSLATLLRVEEATRTGVDLEASAYELSRPGRHKKIPEWYYDPATNSIQNGGLNPKEVPPTKITRKDFVKIVALGLSEEVWDPRNQNISDA